MPNWITNRGKRTRVEGTRRLIIIVINILNYTSLMMRSPKLNSAKVTNLPNGDLHGL